MNRAAPLLAQAASMIGHPQIRHRGTIGGSLAEADPAAQLPAALLALNGSVVAKSTTTTREIPARDLFVSPLTTSLKSDEIITEIRVPTRSARTGSAFLEVVRRQGDFALVGVAVVLTVDGDGLIRSPRIALAAMDGTPVRATEAEGALEGQAPTEALIDQVSRLAMRSGHPVTDTHASGEYRRSAALTLVGRAVKLAIADATNGSNE
nr:xanthine dehydrogenase family protein subunit M [uncultured bacterium]